MDRSQMILTLGTVILVFIALSILIWKKIEDTRKKKIAVSILVFVAFTFIIWFLYYTSFGAYDRFGNRYQDDAQVLYYSMDGQTYIHEGEYYGESYFVNTKKQKECHLDKHSFITKSGYIFFDDSGKKVKSVHKDDMNLYIENGTECYGASEVIFGWTGAVSD